MWLSTSAIPAEHIQRSRSIGRDLLLPAHDCEGRLSSTDRGVGRALEVRVLGLNPLEHLFDQNDPYYTRIALSKRQGPHALPSAAGPSHCANVSVTIRLSLGANHSGWTNDVIRRLAAACSPALCILFGAICDYFVCDVINKERMGRNPP